MRSKLNSSFKNNQNIKIENLAVSSGRGYTSLRIPIRDIEADYDDDQKSLDFAAAACVLKHTVSGDVNLVTLTEVEKLMSEHNSVRIER